MKILVTGAEGQLGTCLQKLAKKYVDINWIFGNKNRLDISNTDDLDLFFSEEKPDFCINTAAYTLVDKAETESLTCDLVNHLAVENLARTANKHQCTLLHVSTDYVFDGEKAQAYNENDVCNPTSAYGKSKLLGEQVLRKYCEKHFNIRTSWLYSPFKNNFVKTMLRLFSEKESISVVADQYGQPTNALDLAQALIDICLHNSHQYGTYHFSNIGRISWYDFAAKIAEITQSKCKILPITTEQYPTAAKRPKNSSLDCNKIASHFPIQLKNWEKSLIEVLAEINSQKP